jgi:hypothetical protein
VNGRWAFLALALGCTACSSSKVANDDEVVDTTLNDGAVAINASTADLNSESMPTEDLNVYAPASEDSADGSFESHQNDSSPSNSTAEESDATNESSEEGN